METSTLQVIVIAGRLIVALAAVLGAICLADREKEGWGWLIFVALWLGGVTVGESR